MICSKILPQPRYLNLTLNCGAKLSLLRNKMAEKRKLLRTHSEAASLRVKETRQNKKTVAAYDGFEISFPQMRKPRRTGAFLTGLVGRTP